MAMLNNQRVSLFTGIFHRFKAISKFCHVLLCSSFGHGMQHADTEPIHTKSMLQQVKCGQSKFKSINQNSEHVENQKQVE